MGLASTVTLDRLVAQIATAARWVAPEHTRAFSEGSYLQVARQLARWLDEGGHLDACEDTDSARDQVTLPISLENQAFLATVGIEAHGLRFMRAESVGEGAFVLGSDNATFGRWNALVAYQASGAPISVFPAHGGELVPGRLNDHVDRIRRNLIDGVKLPVQLDIDISMACASDCRFCFSSPYRAGAHGRLMMDRGLLLKLIEEWADLGVRVVRFDGGGDPLTHPHLNDALRLAHRRGLRTAVLTSGDLLRQGHRDTFVTCRTYVRVSLNAARDSTRLRLHRPRGTALSLGQILEQMQRLAEARQEIRDATERDAMLLGATCLIHPDNVGEMDTIARLTKDAGFDHISFRVVLGETQAVAFSAEALSQASQAFEHMRAEVASESFQIFIPDGALTGRGYCPGQYFDRCLACTHRALVEVGHQSDVAAVIPCGAYRGHGFRWPLSVPEPGLVFGHLTQHTRLRDVWQAPRMQSLVTRVPRVCASCIDRSANLMFLHIEAALTADREARFVRLQTSRWRNDEERAPRLSDDRAGG